MQQLVPAVRELGLTRTAYRLSAAIPTAMYEHLCTFNFAVFLLVSSHSASNIAYRNGMHPQCQGLATVLEQLHGLPVGFI